MLDNFRKLSDNILIKSLFILLVISFVVWGIGDFINISKNDYVAVVDKDSYITTEEFIKEKKHQINQIKQQYPNFSEESLKGLDINNSILSNLVLNRLVQLEAENLGIIISDEIVADHVYQNRTFYNKEGKFTLDKFKYFLQVNRMSQKEFADGLKEDLTRELLISTFSGQIDTPASVVKAIDIYNNQQREASIYSPSYSSKKTFSEKEINNYYLEHLSENFTSPELRNVDFIYVDSSLVSNKARITNDEVNSQFKQLPTSQQTNKNKKLIKTNLLKEKSDKMLFDLIQKIDDEINAGKNLQAISKAYNLKIKKLYKVHKNSPEIPNYNEFKNNIFKASKGMISDVLTAGDTKGGYYIFYVNDIQKSQPMKLDNSLKQKISKTLSKQYVREQNERIISEIKNKLDSRESITSIKNVSIKHKLFSRPSAQQNSNSLISQLFELRKTLETTNIGIYNNKLALFQLKKIINPKSSTKLSKAKSILNSSFPLIQQTLLFSYLQSKYPVKVNYGTLNRI